METNRLNALAGWPPGLSCLPAPIQTSLLYKRWRLRSEEGHTDVAALSPFISHILKIQNKR